MSLSLNRDLVLAFATPPKYSLAKLLGKTCGLLNQANLLPNTSIFTLEMVGQATVGLPVLDFIPSSILISKHKLFTAGDP